MTTNELNTIRSGVVLIHDKAVLPDGIEFRTERVVPGWRVIRDSTSAEIDRALTKAGWHFFYLAEELGESAIARTPEAALKKALQKLATQMERDHKNALEITDVLIRHLPGLYYAGLKAHARHVKKTPFLVDDSTEVRPFARPHEPSQARAA